MLRSRLSKKRKGGVWYLSDIITFISSLFGTLTMLFIAALVIFIMHVNVYVYVNGVLLYDVPNTDNILMTYMETTNQGYRMRDLLTYAVYMENMSFRIGDTEVDLQRTSPIIMNTLTKKPYTLTLETDLSSYELAKAGVPGEHAVAKHTIVQAGEKRALLRLWSG
ncbi:MAG: hypothetical protein ACE5J7_00235 [Candidatus Aenigmatarchaeota archaeon]